MTTDSRLQRDEERLPGLRPDALPQERVETAARHLDACTQALARVDATATLDAPSTRMLSAAFAASDFIAAVARAHPAVVARWPTEPPIDALSVDHYRRTLTEWLGADAVDETTLGRTLRRFRAEQGARIAWRDLFGLAPIDTLLQEQSALAEACVGIALENLLALAREHHGTPRDNAGCEQSLIVLGMGKLGGRELNFSSDIDLILVYGEPGRTDGARPLDNAEFFTRLGQRLIRVLDERTADGFVYRVDMRLRPFGSSGPLVVHLEQLEQYLLTQAREWERFALVKARPLTGDETTIAELDGLLRPFVFRRYLDFGAFEALRDLKGRLEREVTRKGLQAVLDPAQEPVGRPEFLHDADGQLTQLAEHLERGQ